MPTLPSFVADDCAPPGELAARCSMLLGVLSEPEQAPPVDTVRLAVGVVHCFPNLTDWRFAFATAISARYLTRLLDAGDPEQAFQAGLLHRVGELAAAYLAPEDYRQAIFRPARREWELTRLIGEGVEEFSARLMAHWGLPPAPIDAVQNMLDPAVGSDPLQASIVLAADRFCRDLRFGPDGETCSGEVWFDDLPESLVAHLEEFGFCDLTFLLLVLQPLLDSVDDAVAAACFGEPPSLLPSRS